MAVKVKLTKLSLIRRYRKSVLEVSEAEAARMIGSGLAVAVTSFDGPPVNKLVASPGIKKEVAEIKEADTAENPTGKAEEPPKPPQKNKKKKSKKSRKKVKVNIQ